MGEKACRVRRGQRGVHLAEAWRHAGFVAQEPSLDIVGVWVAAGGAQPPHGRCGRVTVAVLDELASSLNLLTCRTHNAWLSECAECMW